jgi:NAD(P)H-hydrate repair Nnr-like enzyme with NAD(P)H-hydrate dehydratase domain
VLLKGSTTVVVSGVGGAYINPTGTPRLATAGSGDVLAGLAGALLAGGKSAAEAGAVAAYLHGVAARLASQSEGAGGSAPVTAMDVAACLPAAWREVADC